MFSSPLQSMHEQAEATFLPYGPELQIVESYGEVEAEYSAIRKAAALMDVPQRALVVLTGKDRLAFLNNLVTNETKKLAPGQGVYAYLLNTKGRIVMDLNIIHAEDATLLELDTRLAPELLRMFEKYLFAEDVKVLDASGQLGRLSVMGPQARALLLRVCDGDLPLDEPLRHVKRTIARTTVTVFRQDTVGEEGFELIVPRDSLVSLWQILHEAGGENGESELGLRAIGWSAFNIARIEAGTPLYGIDLTENYLPMETGHWYLRAVSVTKGCYLGQEIVARMHAHDAVARLLVGLRVEGERLPMAGTDILDDKAQVGIITSSCMSPLLGHVPVALGYVKKAFAEAGKTVTVLAEGQRVQAKVAPLPFWRRAAVKG